MPSVIERLRRALAPTIAVEREIARGGMGTVFLGRDTLLDRRVAIKIIPPEKATAVAVERFLLEARHAAQLSHSNVVRVHHAGEADGLLYYIMDYIEGQTLAARLRKGPLSAQETVALGCDLLDALATAHAARLIHRDIKPANIFLDRGRALLSDFGLAQGLEPDRSVLTEPGQLVGTRAYMAPEQLRDGPVTTRTDLYALGMVLFEGCTGRRWEALTDPDDGDWTGVPASLRRPLRKALQLVPERRWRDAERFAASLRSSPVQRRAGWGLIAMAVVAALAFALRAWLWSEPAAPPADLAIFPFETVGARDTALGAEIAGLTGWYFDRLPRVTLASRHNSFRAWRESSLPPSERLAQLTAKKLKTRYGIWGVVRPRGKLLEVQLSAVNGRGEPVLQAVVRADSADHLALGDSIALRVVSEVFPRFERFYRDAGTIAQVNPAAIPEFFQGEEAFSRDAWLTAEGHYAAALALDSSFVLAAWRLGNARRWMPLRAEPPFPVDFLPLYHTHGRALAEADRRLIEAQFAPSGAPRFHDYEEALRVSHDDAYAALLYGDELFHRGPLAGRPLTDAVAMLRRAVASDSSLAPAWEHLAWALIRLGRRAGAERALGHLARVAGRPEESEIYLPAFLQLAFALRFGLVEAGSADGVLGAPDALGLAARGALAFDLPDAEVALGRRLAAVSSAPPALRGSGWVAQGAGLVALGRPSAAFAALDSAASLLPDTAEGWLQAAEWRVIPAALGLPGVPSSAVEEGRQALAARASVTGRGSRAAWALAIDALARRDTLMGRTWRAMVTSGSASPGPGPLDLLLDAMTAAAHGHPGRALAISEPVLAFDSAGYAPDPFLRASLHLLRGEWLAADEQMDAADRSWLWYQNTDVVGWPRAEAQAAEVDWALSSYARWRRSQLARSRGDRARACEPIARLLQIWSDPEAAMATEARRVKAAAGDCPP